MTHLLNKCDANFYPYWRSTAFALDAFISTRALMLNPACVAKARLHTYIHTLTHTYIHTYIRASGAGQPQQVSSSQRKTCPQTLTILVVLRFCYTSCRNCVGTIRTIVETAVETVVKYIETVACSLKNSDFFPQIIISTVPTKTQQFLQRFLQ